MTSLSVPDRISELQREIEALRAQVNRIDTSPKAMLGMMRRVRLAITGPDSEEYPNGPAVYPIKFVDPSFAETYENEDLTTVDRQDSGEYFKGFYLGKGHLQPETIVACIEQGGQWYILCCEEDPGARTDGFLCECLQYWDIDRAFLIISGMTQPPAASCQSCLQWNGSWELYQETGVPANPCWLVAQQVGVPSGNLVYQTHPNLTQFPCNTVDDESTIGNTYIFLNFVDTSGGNCEQLLNQIDVDIFVAGCQILSLRWINHDLSSKSLQPDNVKIFTACDGQGEGSVDGITDIGFDWNPYTEEIVTGINAGTVVQPRNGTSPDNFPLTPPLAACGGLLTNFQGGASPTTYDFGDGPETINDGDELTYDTNYGRWFIRLAAERTGGGEFGDKPIWYTTCEATEFLDYRGCNWLSTAQGFLFGLDFQVVNRDNVWEESTTRQSWIPQKDDVGIGSINASPSFIAVGSVSRRGIEGFFSKGNPIIGGVQISGFRNEEIPSGTYPEPNAPVDIRGSSIVLDGDTGFAVPQDIADDHYLISTPTISIADGRKVLPVAMGPPVVYSKQESSTDNNDIELLDGIETLILSITTTNTYGIGATISSTLNLGELSGRTANIDVVFKVNSVEIYRKSTARSGNTSPEISIYPIISSISISDVIEVFVESTASHPSTSAWVLGASIASTLDIQETGGGISVGSFAYKSHIVVSRNDINGDYVCDGTNDHVELQAALTAAGTSKAKVLIKPGVYDIGLPCVVPAGVEVEGFGYNTELRLKDATNTDILQIENSDNVRIAHLRLNGNRANQTGEYYNLRIRGSNYVKIENIWTHDARRQAAEGQGEGIYVTNSTYVTVEGCYSYLNGGVGIKMTNALGACTYCKIIDCETWSNDNDNILMFRNVASEILGCIAVGGGTDGITIHGPDASDDPGTQQSKIADCISIGNAEDGIVGCTNGEECIITDNISKSNGHDGINLFRSAEFCNISDNICNENGHYGIWIQGLSDNTRPIDRCIVANNHCHDNDSGNTNTYSGIAVGFSSSNCIINGNNCSGATQNYGINIRDTGCTNNIVSDNIVIGNNFGGVRDAGTNNYLWNNIESNTPQTEGKYFDQLLPTDKNPATTGGPTYVDRTSGSSNFTRPALNYPAGSDTEAAWVRVLPHNYAGNSIRLSSGITVELHFYSVDNESGTQVKLGVSIERNQPGVSSININGFATEKVITPTVNYNAGSQHVTTTAIVSFSHGAEMDNLQAGEGYRVRVRRLASDTVNDTLVGQMGLLNGYVRED